ncbi:MAG: hypothetical protein Q8N60_04400 [Candidatus Diapherotrites archaeon]|nr:hypothetical protein [Candidatus Diapherotrites archaeon]
MRCPKCGTEMRAVDFAELAGDRVLMTLECPGCHYRAQQEQGKRYGFK